MKQSKITLKQNKKINEESSEVNMVEHKKYNFKELNNMTKAGKIKALVEELNAMSEDIYEINGKRLLKLDEPYHFYFEKAFGLDIYYIARGNKLNDEKFKYVATFQEAQNRALDGFAEISEPQQRLIMKFILSLKEGSWYE